MARARSVLCLGTCLALLLVDSGASAAVKPGKTAVLKAVGLEDPTVQGAKLSKGKVISKAKPPNERAAKIMAASAEEDKDNLASAETGRGGAVISSQAASGPACNTTKDAEMREYFQDVVLVLHINYAWVAHRTAAFWRNIYGRLFKHIVIVSDEDIPNLGVEVRSPERNIKDWRMCYFNVPKIMARYPDAAGFLWTNDDVVINYWNLVGADKTKLWMPNNPKLNTDIRWFPRDFTVKGLWDRDWPAANRWKKVMRRALDGMDREYKRRYERNILPHKKEYPKRITDLFYIPRRHVEEFSFNLMPVFQGAGAPSELALPSMFYALDSPKNWDPVLDPMVFRWDLWEAKMQHRRSSFRPEEAWSASFPAFHPWKVAKDDAKIKLIEALMTADPCIGNP